MGSSDKKRNDTANPRQRSHRGCWTCKKKRIQCDEGRPGCQRCITRGISCEGYEIRLRWGAGIASRGRYNGAEKPVKEFIPPPSKRRWDLRGKGENGEEGDRQGQPDLLLASSFIPDQSVVQPITVCTSSRRATVNILNEPYGQDLKDYLDVTKHFELPVSTGEGMPIPSDNSPAFNETQHIVTGQYSSKTSLPGRSLMIA